jgi:hypothetical protein
MRKDKRGNYREKGKESERNKKLEKRHCDIKGFVVFAFDLQWPKFTIKNSLQV